VGRTTQYEDGDPDSPMLILGQAPSSSEVRYGRPFVGPSGEVLRDCLHAIGTTRRNVYLLNIWEEPVYTDRKGLIWTDRSSQDLLWSPKGITPLGYEMAAGTLARICQSQSTTLVPMGQQALELCTGISKAVMKWRGSPLLGLERVGGKFVIPTIHPAATIHGVYLWRYLIISDLKKAQRQSTSSKSLAPERSIIIRPSLDDILQYTRTCQERKRVSTDLEVINHQVSCFCLVHKPEEAMVVPFMDEQGEMWTEDEEIKIWKAYADLMYDDQVMKVNQNIVGFDAPFLYQQNQIYIRGPIGDTMIAQHALYPEFNKGLDFIASIHTDEPYWKDEGKMWKNQGGDWPTFWRYNGKDGCVSLEAWDVLAEELTQRDMWATYNFTADMLPSLLYATLDGLAIDFEALEQTKTSIAGKIDAKEKELLSVADYEFNPLSPAQVKKYLYDHKGIKPYKNAQGGITTDDKALSRIIRKYPDLREARFVQELRALKKLKSTYLDVEADPDGRLRCSWNPRGTWTGRLSSSQTIFGRGLNLQNLDPSFKQFIVDDDYGTMESCAIALEAEAAD
jgi:uracil-DNA glycosylase